MGLQLFNYQTILIFEVLSVKTQLLNYSTKTLPYQIPNQRPYPTKSRPETLPYQIPTKDPKDPTSIARFASRSRLIDEQLNS